MPRLEIAQKSTTLDRQCGMWPGTSVSLAFAPRLGSGSTTNHPSTTPIFGATTE